MPYIELATDKGYLRFLVDTGANKSYIRPDHVNKARTLCNAAKVQTVNGSYKIDKFINFNPFPNNPSCETSQFYVFNFHKYFDGILGYEFLQKCNATIDASSNTLRIGEKIINMKRKFPASVSINAHETKFVKIANCNSTGDFLLPRDIELQPSVFINSGIYRANKQNALVAISNLTDNEISLPYPHVNIELNNFETEMPAKEHTRIKTKLFERLRLDHLNSEERKTVFKIIADNQNCFHLEDEKLTFSNVIKHKIETKDDIPVHAKTYRYPHCHKKEVKEQIQKMLEQNIIRPSHSPWSSPIWVVPKKADASGKKKWRLVVDYRKVNEKTIDDRYPIPNITDTLDKLGKCQYFTTLDLASGFNQIEVDENDIKKTAFSVENGHYEYLRMPFGLKNAPATFQRVMDHVLKDFIGKICVIYMDDILIFSTSLHEHAESLGRILKALQEFNLKIQLDKSEFLKKETAFLGHIITTKGVKPNPEKISAIQSWPLPRNEKELKGFLGTLGYYRKFIRDFARIVKPLTNQLRKGEKLDHSKQFIETFEKCKNILTTSDVLQYPDFSKPFVLTTDASNYAIGAVLSQGPIGRDKPVAFASRTLSVSEENYSVIEKELLAIVWACKYFRPYIFGNKFTLYTDHQPLTYIFNMKDPSSKLVRWRLSLEEYDYEIKYRKGAQNVVADGLSRINFNKIENVINSSDQTSMENNVDESSDNNTAHSADTDDTHFIKMSLNPINFYANQIILEVSEEETENVQQIFPRILRSNIKKKRFDQTEILNIFRNHLDYKKVNGILCPERIIPAIQAVYREYFCRNKTLKIVISQKLLKDVMSAEEQNSIIEETHNRAHRGINENYMVLSQNYYFPRMKTKLRKFIALCSECRASKYDRKPYKITLAETPQPKKPLDIIHVDIFISSPNTFLSAVDKFSRFGILIPIKSRSIPDVRGGLIKLFAMFRQPKMIVSDNEPSLKSIEIRGFLEDLNIHSYYTPTNRSEVNGIVERFHSTIAEIFRCVKSKHENLCNKNLFQLAVSLYNSTIHTAHKMKPCEIFYATRDNEERPLNIDLIEQSKRKLYDEVSLELKKKQKQDLLNHNKDREEEPKLEKDETVFVARQGIKSKIKPKFEAVKVTENQNKTFTDSKNRKLHKANMKRRPID